jgi:hypothetical protein
MAGIRELPWHWIAAGSHIALATLAALHAMLFNYDPRAAGLGVIALAYTG